MGHRFAELAFTPIVRELQTHYGSRRNYEKKAAGPDRNAQLTGRESEFIEARDSFYMASVSETGWPYVQHRGGPPGFVKVLSSERIGFADFGGNRQYVSTGNLLHDDRVALIFVDYPNRRRLKVLGHVTIADAEDALTMKPLKLNDYPASFERGFVIQIAAFDWNCSQHITPRYSEAEVEARVDTLRTQE